MNLINLNEIKAKLMDTSVAFENRREEIVDIIAWMEKLEQRITYLELKHDD